LTTLERLHLVPIFNRLSEDDLALIERLVKRVRYYKDAPVCQQGEIGIALYIIDSGAVQVEHVDSRGKQRTLDTKREGDFFGETALLFGEPFQTSFVAEEDSDILVIRRDEFHELMLQYPDLYQRFRESLPPAYQARFQVRFNWLMDGEVVILHARKHWWAFVRELPAAIGVIVSALVIAIVVMALAPSDILKILVWAIAILIVGLTLVYQTIDWRNDDYIVTNRRVIHIERVLLVRVERREATIDKVQNVEIKQPTLLQKIVGVSDVLISTAAVHGTITFATVANGAAIRNVVFEQMQRAQAQRMFESRSKLKEEIRAELERGTKPLVVRPPTATPLAPKTVTPPRVPLGRAIRDRFSTRVVFGNTITWRKHWIALLVQAGKPALGIAGGLLGILLTALQVLPTPAFVLVGIVWLFFIGWFIWEFIDWSNDIYQVTPDRIVDVERNPLGVIQHSLEAPLAQVQNVTYRQPNVFAVLLGIGDVLIETAGQTGQMIFYWMSPPAQVANEILQAVERVRERQRMAQRAAQRADMFEWLSAYHSYLEESERLRHSESSSPEDTDDPWSQP